MEHTRLVSPVPSAGTQIVQITARWIMAISSSSVGPRRAHNATDVRRVARPL